MPPAPSLTGRRVRVFASGGRAAWVFAVAFLALYLAIDWITFIHEPPALNVTPWNPPAGLYMALLLVGWPRASLLVFAALLSGDVLVRGMPAPLPLLAISNLLILLCYWCTAMILRRAVRLRPQLDRLSDMAWLIAAVAVGAVPAAFGFALPYVIGGLLAGRDLLAVALQYWVGDVIGILTVTPFVMVLLRQAPVGQPQLLRPVELLLQGLAVAVGLMVTFNRFVPDPSKIFYVLFLPIIWIAMRRGLPGATMAILATQVGLVVGLLALPDHRHDLLYYQSLMLALVTTGLLVGAVVSERWRLEQSLRERQSELTRISRLSLLGEMASSLAHELNQPLFTTVGYTRAGRQLLLRGGDRDAVVDLMNRAEAEAQRAADVLKSIRGFLKQGGQASAVSLPAVIDEMLALAKPEAARAGIAVTVSLPPDLPALWADKVQIDQVLLNLLRNSIDALLAVSGRTKEIVVAAELHGGMVEISVTDTGPGVPEDKIDPLFDLFFTTKPSGMGLGLPICRSIIEAHGGRLWLAANSAAGARFAFTLPVAT